MGFKNVFRIKVDISLKVQSF